MTLLDHFAQNAGPVGDGGNGFVRLPAHQFTDSLYLWAIGEITRINVINAWSLTTTGPIADRDETQLDELATNYASEPDARAKLEYISKVEAVFRLYEYGKLTETQVKNFLGLS